MEGVVGRAYRSKTTVLPRYPLFAKRELGILGKGELLFRVKVSGQVREDGHALHDALGLVSCFSLFIVGKESYTKPSIVMIH